MSEPSTNASDDTAPVLDGTDISADPADRFTYGLDLFLDGLRLRHPDSNPRRPEGRA